MVAMKAMKHLEQWGRKGTLWIDCYSVLDRCTLVGANGSIPMVLIMICWLKFFALCKVGEDIVQLVEVSSHQVWNHGTPAVLRWAMVHNACVDWVARLANQLRGDEFWSLWQLHSAMVHRLQFVSNRIQSHQMEVCRRWSAGTQGVSCFTAPRPLRHRRVFPMVWEIVTVLLHMPRAFVTLVGQPVADILHEWWSRLFVELFQQYSKHPGLICNGRGWLYPTDLPACLPECSSFKVRSKWFRLTLQRFWRDAKFKISIACTRPRSTMPTCLLGCTVVPVPLAFLTSLDVWLWTHLSAPVNGQGKALNKAPLVFV